MSKSNTKSRKLKPGEVIELGMQIRDTVTEIVGYASYRLRFLQGCDHIGIMVPGVTEDGKMKDLFQTDVLNFEIMVDQTDRFPAPPEIVQTIFVGDIVKDKITDREGVVTAYQISLFDGPGIHIQPKGVDKDGKAKNAFALEPGRAMLIARGSKHGIILPLSEFVEVAPAPEVKKVPGGPARPLPQKYK